MITLKTADRLPSLEVVLENLTEAGYVAQNLTGCTVAFRLRNSAGTTVIDGACTVTDATAGQVRYDWGATDTTTAGIYSGTFRVTNTATSKVRTYPQSGFIPITVETGIPAISA